MKKPSRQIVLHATSLVLAAVLQIWASQWRIFFDQLIAIGEFGAGTAWLAIVDILLGVASGILLAVILFPKASLVPGTKIPGSVITLAFLIPIVAIGIKLGAALGMPIALPLNLGLGIVVWDWTMKSGLPPVWLGMAIVTLSNWLKQGDNSRA